MTDDSAPALHHKPLSNAELQRRRHTREAIRIGLLVVGSTSAAAFIFWSGKTEGETFLLGIMMMVGFVGLLFMHHLASENPNTPIDQFELAELMTWAQENPELRLAVVQWRDSGCELTRREYIVAREFRDRQSANQLSQRYRDQEQQARNALANLTADPD